MGGSMFVLCTPSRPMMLRSLTPYLHRLTKRYSQGSNNSNREHVIDVKAPSLADEFKRVAEEKAQAHEEQSLASQTSDKAFDGSQAVSDADIEKVKERYREHGSRDDYCRRGD